MVRLRKEEPESWSLELYAEVIFATVGLGRGPVKLALSFLKDSCPGTHLAMVAPGIKTTFARVQQQTRPRPVEEERAAKRARKGNGDLNSSSSSAL